jgi:hypothetical protein
MRRFAWLAIAALAWGCAQADVAAPDAGSCEGDPSAQEACNGVDDNCDGVVDEGFPNVGVICVVGEGRCAVEGKTVCDPEGGPGATRCIGEPLENTPELCGNGVDDDCDGLLDEGFANHGMPCTVGVGVCQRSGKLKCAEDGVALVCDQPPGMPGEELCGNSADDDCDGMEDEGFEALMTACDGADADMCLEGMWLCSGDGLSMVCSDPNDVDVEMCNTLDDDCNASTADGTQDPGFNMDCDGGGDADLCKEGKTFCTGGGALACSDPNDPDPDVCNNFDDDCNAATADGSGDVRIGQGCDGAGDGDMCIEGVFTSCAAGGVLVCSDPVDDDLTNDEANCGMCGISCTNPHGSTVCTASACDPNCDFGWQACGLLRDGCGSLRNGNPTCTSDNRISDVDGDSGSDVRVVNGYGEAYYEVTILENDGDSDDPQASITLQSPPGVNFQLCVRCDDCGGGIKCDNSGGAGEADRVDVRADDDFIVSDDFDANIFIQFLSGDDTSCGDWTLTVRGNVSTSNELSCEG